MAVLPDEFRGAMRHFPAVVNLITTGRPGGRAGLTATAAMSLTAEPPQLVVAVNHEASAYPLLIGNGSFALNVLPEAEVDLANIFAGRTGADGEARFAGGDWIELVTGSPVLRDANVSFDCTLVREIPVATHSLLIGLVEAVRVAPALPPLLHMDGGWASLIRAAPPAIR